MPATALFCAYCNKKFFRYPKYVRENIKLHQRTYCSNKCVGLSNRKYHPILQCENTTCNKSFIRRRYEISKHNYCSSSCAALVNNKKFPKHRGIRKICATCKKVFVSREKYCSTSCQYQGQVVTKETIIEKLHMFYKAHGRIPLKREFHHPRAARERFGSWNNAIKAAGFSPNPVMFAKKYTAKDGHICDSLAEKIIDDWLYRKKISHKRRIHYPGNPTLTVDFVVGDYWIEFFGLYGQHRRYDALRKEKLTLVKKYNLKFIDLYPHHLFPKNNLTEILLALESH